MATLGFSGVDLFFVLSGFLITRILLDNRTAANFYGTFYMRRVLRIFPLYYGAVAVTFLVMPALERLHPYWGMSTHHVPWNHQVWFWLNLSNFRTAFAPFLVAPLAHFWTLAIEEQFYFVWPTVVRHCSNKSLRVICLCGSVAPLLLRLGWHFFLPNYGPNFFERITVFHMEGLFLGAGIALLERERAKSRGVIRRWAVVCGMVGLLGIALNQVNESSILSLALTTALSLFYASIVAYCVFPSRDSRHLMQFLSARPLRSVGSYSYFIYVFHIAVIYYLGVAVTHVQNRTHLVTPYWVSVVEALVGFLVLYGLGALSWRWVESPILGLKRYYAYRFTESEKNLVKC